MALKSDHQKNRKPNIQLQDALDEFWFNDLHFDCYGTSLYSKWLKLTDPDFVLIKDLVDLNLGKCRSENKRKYLPTLVVLLLLKWGLDHETFSPLLLFFYVLKQSRYVATWYFVYNCSVECFYVQGVSQEGEKFCILHELCKRLQIRVLGVLWASSQFQTWCKRLHVNFRKDKSK